MSDQYSVPVGTPLQAIGGGVHLRQQLTLAAPWRASRHNTSPQHCGIWLRRPFLSRSDPKHRTGHPRWLGRCWGRWQLCNSPMRPHSATEDSRRARRGQAPPNAGCNYGPWLTWAESMSVSSPCRCWRVQPALCAISTQYSVCSCGMPEGDSPNAHRCVETGR